jgi:hypothetical protein
MAGWLAGRDGPGPAGWQHGLVCRPVPMRPTATIVVAWPRTSTSRQVAAFVRAASAAAHQHRRESAQVTATSGKP